MLWVAYFMGLVIFYALINWMPVLFKDGIALDIFGRVGIFDQFTVKHDPVLQMTTFDWIGPQGVPWSTHYEKHWSTKRAARDGSTPAPPSAGNGQQDTPSSET